jgi:hypothetical protein
LSCFDGKNKTLAGKAYCQAGIFCSLERSHPNAVSFGIGFVARTFFLWRVPDSDCNDFLKMPYFENYFEKIKSSE